MLHKYTAFLRRNVRFLSGLLFVAVVVSWTLSLWFPFIKKWLVDNNFFWIILTGLLVQVIALLDEMTKGSGIQTAIGHDQDEDLNKLRDYVREKRPSSADLIEYSSFMVNSLLQDLRRQNANIRLLICDPSYAINEWQTHRIETCIETLRDVTLRDYKNACVRLYRVPSSVRGRKIDDHLNLGWYFYGHSLYGIQGTATMFTVKTGTTEGRVLQTLFDESFDMLWNHPETRELDMNATQSG